MGHEFHLKKVMKDGFGMKKMPEAKKLDQMRQDDQLSIFSSIVIYIKLQRCDLHMCTSGEKNGKYGRLACTSYING